MTVRARHWSRAFERLRTRIMQIDHSFERAARALEHVYMRALEIEAA